MKKIFGIVLCVLLISLCAFALADVEINTANFPDENFREYVRQFDTDGNGSFSDEELAKANFINVYEKQISSLQGVEYFTAITWLNCQNNQLTFLDVSKNTALTDIFCSDNQLTSLDVSKNTALIRINCCNNYLTSLDVSKNTALTELDCLANWQLASLDVSKNTALTWLRCSGNCLTSLDISKNTALTYLDCSANQLNSLDVSKNNALTEIACDSNQLTSLDVSKNTKLTWLSCSSNLLTSLDISKNNALTGLFCAQNQLTSLKPVKTLTKITCFENKITSLDIRQCPELLKIVKGVKPTVWYNYFGWCENPNNLYDSNYLFIDEGVEVITGDEITVSKIKLNKNKATLTRTSGKKKPTLQLKATVTLEDATDLSVEWKSSDPKIAKVDKNGKVTALKAGKATITCTAKNAGGVKATCDITVKDQQVTKMTLNKKTISLKKGKTSQLKVTIKPADALNRKVKWTSSDKKVATVDKNGKVKAIGKGSCVITCEALDDSGKMITCKVIVK